MKKITLTASLILLFSLSIPTVKSPFIELDHESTLEEGEIIPLSIEGTCYVPPWTSCPSGYSCVELTGTNWLYAEGRKVGKARSPGFTTDGLQKYKIRTILDPILLYWYTVSSKTLFTGEHEVQFSHPWYPELDFGTPTSPKATCGANWERVDNQMLYPDSLDYGWDDTTNLESIDRGGDCYPWRDFVLSTSDHIFIVDLINSEYRVKLHIGDNVQDRDFIDVYAEGELKVDDLNYSYNPDGGFYRPEEVTFDVTVSDFKLDLKFHDDGGTDPYWVINAIQIKNIGPVYATFVSTSLDFDYLDPGPAYLFEPSYVYGQNAAYEDCGILWINFTNADLDKISVKTLIEYKTYILDFNEDDQIDVFDAIILSNEFGQSWGSPGDAVDPNDDTWRADINSDGSVNIIDYSILKNQFGTEYIDPSLAGSAVTELIISLSPRYLRSAASMKSGASLSIASGLSVAV